MQGGLAKICEHLERLIIFSTLEQQYVSFKWAFLPKFPQDLQETPFGVPSVSGIVRAHYVSNREFLHFCRDS